MALPSATVEQDIYFYYEKQILQTVRGNPDAVGIYIFFHGSMEVDGIGSGELYLLKEIRRIVGKDCIISMSMDAHANITAELGDYANITCGFKTIPHTDQKESQTRAANALVYALKNKVRPYLYVQYVALKDAGSKTRLIANLWGWTKDFGWSDEDVIKGIDKLDKDIEILSVSEFVTIIKDGKPFYVGEYSMSNVGPCEETKKKLTYVKKTGRKTLAKVQVSKYFLLQDNAKKYGNKKDKWLSKIMIKI